MSDNPRDGMPWYKPKHNPTCYCADDSDFPSQGPEQGPGQAVKGTPPPSPPAPGSPPQP